METEKIMTGHAENEITEKKSRFIADIFEIHSEDEAQQLLEGIRKKYYDARHNCYAYVLGEKSDIQRFSDDKEPQGTAGKPILDVITGNSLKNTLIVVTRYFGGILLGTGGLTRAYSSAAGAAVSAALESDLIFPVCHGTKCIMECAYNLTGKIQYLINSMEVPVLSTEYGASVTYELIVPDDIYDRFSEKITEATNAASELICEGGCIYIISQGKPVIYSF